MVLDGLQGSVRESSFTTCDHDGTTWRIFCIVLIFHYVPTMTWADVLKVPQLEANPA